MSYLFLAIPNFCGSTLVHNILTTSKNVVALKDHRPMKNDGSDDWRIDFAEGNCIAPLGYKNLFGPHSMEANMEHVYADPNNYNWKHIKKRWNKNWKANNEFAKIRLQKTPADIFRIKMMLDYFPNTKWVVSVRNPYSYIESIMRKASFQMDPLRQLDQVVFHSLRVLELQLENIQLLGENCYAMTYEDFCSRPEYHASKWIEFIPELEALDLSKEIWVKGNFGNIIHDDSEERIQRLIENVPDIIDRVNIWIKPMGYLLDKWGYNVR